MQVAVSGARDDECGAEDYDLIVRRRYIPASRVAQLRDSTPTLRNLFGYVLPNLMGDEEMRTEDLI